MQTKPIEISNGKYIWQYRMSLFKNPTVFLTTAKAILIALGITILIIGLISCISDGFSADSFRFVGQLALIMLGIFAVLLVLGYLLYAAIMGGSVIVHFTMDEKEIVFVQDKKQSKKAETIGTAAMIMGTLAHNRGAVSAGYAASSRMSSTVELNRVKSVVVDKNRSVIKIRSFGWDHVYADGDDFDFVVDWIRRHVPEAAEWTVKG